MRANHTDHVTLSRIIVLCQEAIDQQHRRYCREGFGLDDYTEGSIVGAANLARKLMRVLSGTGVDAVTPRTRHRGADPSIASGGFGRNRTR